MPGIGTIVNALAILAGGTVGLLAKKGFPERFRTIIFDAVGCAVFLIGLTGVLTNCLYITEEGGIGSRYIMELLLSLVLVWTVGEILCNTNSGVFIANHAPASHRARYQSIYDIIQNLGKAAGPFLMGFYLLGHSYQQGWLFVSGLCLLAALGLILLQRHPALPPEEGGRHKPQKRKAAI